MVEKLKMLIITMVFLWVDVYLIMSQKTCVFIKKKFLGPYCALCASKINMGMIGINVPIPVPVAYHTFGGWKQSVFGDIAMHGAENVHFYTRSKTVTVRWPINKKELGTFDMQSH